jgi:hypothetical protein
MQTADGEVIFSVGQDTLTADQLLELLERDEQDAEGVLQISRGAGVGNAMAGKLRLRSSDSAHSFPLVSVPFRTRSKT